MNAVIESVGHLAGFAFVVLVLSVLWVVVASVGSLFSKIDEKKKATAQSKAKSAVASVTAPAITSSNSDEVPEEDLVIIASTVAMLLGKRTHRLVSIKTNSRTWGHEGRREHVMSHKLN